MKITPRVVAQTTRGPRADEPSSERAQGFTKLFFGDANSLTTSHDPPIQNRQGMRRQTSDRDPVKRLYAISADVPVLRSGRPGTLIHIDGENTARGDCRLWVLDKRKLYVADAGDFFDALIILRTILEKRGIQMLCNGSREDVWPSEKSRERELGLVAYVCHPGRFATERVYIFESAENSHCVTVAEQKTYIEQWLTSRGAA